MTLFHDLVLGVSPGVSRRDWGESTCCSTQVWVQQTGVACHRAKPRTWPHGAERRSRSRPRCRCCSCGSRSRSGQGHERQRAGLAPLASLFSRPACSSPLHFVRAPDTCTMGTKPLCRLLALSRNNQRTCARCCVRVSLSTGPEEEGGQEAFAKGRNSQQGLRQELGTQQVPAGTAFEGNGGGLGGHSKTCSMPSHHRRSELRTPATTMSSMTASLARDAPP